MNNERAGRINPPKTTRGLQTGLLKNNKSEHKVGYTPQ